MLRLISVWMTLMEVLICNEPPHPIKGGSMTDASMQQFTFIKAHTFEWREVAAPKIEDAIQAIVRPLAVTRCDLDLYIATGAIHMADVPLPLAMRSPGKSWKSVTVCWALCRATGSSSPSR